MALRDTSTVGPDRRMVAPPWLFLTSGVVAHSRGLSEAHHSPSPTSGWLEVIASSAARPPHCPKGKSAGPGFHPERRRANIAVSARRRRAFAGTGVASQRSPRRQAELREVCRRAGHRAPGTQHRRDQASHSRHTARRRRGESRKDHFWWDSPRAGGDPQTARRCEGGLVSVPSLTLGSPSTARPGRTQAPTQPAWGALMLRLPCDGLFLPLSESRHD